MDNKYKILFSLKNKLYFDAAPVLIEAGSDNTYFLKSDSENLQKPCPDSYDFGRPIVRSASACMGEESRDAAVSL